MPLALTSEDGRAPMDISSRYGVLPPSGTEWHSGTSVGDGRSRHCPVTTQDDSGGRSPIENSWGADNLGIGDLRALLSYTEQIASLIDTAGLRRMLAGLAGLVQADAATLTRIDLRSGQEMTVIWPESRVVPDVLADYAAVSATHPVRPFLAQQAARIEAHQWAPIRISDVVSVRQWQGSALYAASHRGIDDQMCGLIGARGSVIQLLVLSSYHGLFTDRQAALLSAGRAHLTAAVRRIGLQTRPMLQLSPQLRWVTGQVAIPDTAPGRPFATSRPTGVIESRGFGADLDLLTGQCEVGPVRQDAGRLASTTTRQRQVLSLVAEGLTDAQIGRRLGLSSATVSKHLNRAYKAVGRTESGGGRPIARSCLIAAPGRVGRPRLRRHQREPQEPLAGLRICRTVRPAFLPTPHIVQPSWPKHRANAAAPLIPARLCSPFTVIARIDSSAIRLMLGIPNSTRYHVAHSTPGTYRTRHSFAKLSSRELVAASS